MVAPWLCEHHMSKVCTRLASLTSQAICPKVGASGMPCAYPFLTGNTNPLAPTFIRPFAPLPLRCPLQTFIKNLVQGWGMKSMGEAFEAGGRTSPEQFRADPASMRLETQPIIDKGASKGLVISIQVRSGGVGTVAAAVVAQCCTVVARTSLLSVGTTLLVGISLTPALEACPVTHVYSLMSTRVSTRMGAIPETLD